MKNASFHYQNICLWLKVEILFRLFLTLETWQITWSTFQSFSSSQWTVRWLWGDSRGIQFIFQHVEQTLSVCPLKPEKVKRESVSVVVLCVSAGQTCRITLFIVFGYEQTNESMDRFSLQIFIFKKHVSIIIIIMFLIRTLKQIMIQRWAESKDETTRAGNRTERLKRFTVKKFKLSHSIVRVSVWSRQSFESVRRSVSAEQSQTHRVHAVLQTQHTVHLHRVVVRLTHTHTQLNTVTHRAQHTAV